MASSFQGAKRAGEVLIDPCTGHSLSREELEERLQPYRRRPGMGADFEAPLGLFLQPAPARDILARMLRNLKEVHRATQDWPRLLNVLHRLVILLPAVPEERRDRALVLAELGQLDLALDDLVFYLHQCPNAVDVDAMAERQSAWRSNLSGRHLH